MKKKDIEKEHILNRKGLHDLMMKHGLEEHKKYQGKVPDICSDKDEISQTIYEYINYISKKNRSTGEIYDWNYDLPSKYTDLKIQDFFKFINFFEYEDDKFIFWIFDNKKTNEINYLNSIEFLECLINNYSNINKYIDDLKYKLVNYKKILNDTKNSLNQQLFLKENFEKYDYVKKLNEKKDIFYEDVYQCTQYLGASEYNTITLTIEQKICLQLIVLYGIKNMYFNSSDYYKILRKNYYYTFIENLPVWMESINKTSISKGKLYSKNYEYMIDLIEEFKIFETNAEKNYKIFRRYTLFSDYIKESLQLIYFDYLIKNSRFEDAREYLDKNSIFLYSNFNKYFVLIEKLNYSNEAILKDIIFDYNLCNYDDFRGIDNIDVLFSDNEYKIKIVIPVLKFLINYFYLLRKENKKIQADFIYCFLKIFNKGFEIDDFFIRYNYELLLSEINEFKVDNDDDIDKAIELIEQKISQKNPIDKYDIERIKNKYPHIDFTNLDKKTQKYIATGDTILLIFNDSNDIGFDYSSAVIEWSKAVELETYNKLTNHIKQYTKEINNNIKGEAFKFGSTIGTFKAINDRKMKDGRNMSEFLYDEYYRNLYNFDKNEYKELINNIISIHETRNDSAHKDKRISFNRAKECQNVILSAKKILEILSKLKKIDKK